MMLDNYRELEINNAFERAKELQEAIEEQFIIDKNVKLFNELKQKEMQRFEKPDGVSNDLFMWVMFAMGLIGIIFI